VPDGPFGSSVSRRNQPQRRPPMRRRRRLLSQRHDSFIDRHLPPD
jgi:hypothetical protein